MIRSRTAELSFADHESGRTLRSTDSTMFPACLCMIVSVSTDILSVSRIEFRVMMAFVRWSGSERDNERNSKDKIYNVALISTRRAIKTVCATYSREIRKAQ